MNAAVRAALTDELMIACARASEGTDLRFEDVSRLEAVASYSVLIKRRPKELEQAPHLLPKVTKRFRRSRHPRPCARETDGQASTAFAKHIASCLDRGRRAHGAGIVSANYAIYRYLRRSSSSPLLTNYRGERAPASRRFRNLLSFPSSTPGYDRRARDFERGSTG